MTLTPELVLARLRQAARTKAGFILSPHAFSRAKHRNVALQDVVSALRTAQHAEKQDNGRWRIKGLDEDGDELDVIVDMGPPIQVITVM